MKIAFFDTKPYDRTSFDKYGAGSGIEFKYFETKLNEDTADLATGFDGVCVFVNDTVNAQVIDKLVSGGVKYVALRCAGFNNVDMRHAYGKVHVLRVPAYSPYAVAEHTMALLLTSIRRIHKAYNRTRDFNFSLNGLTGFDLHGKTVGVVGTGKIGRIFMDICRGFGMKVIAYDPYPSQGYVEYVSLEELFERSDIISLHCPLTEETHHLIDEKALDKCKKGVVWKDSVANYYSHSLMRNYKLKHRLLNGTYKISKYIEFTIYEPKKREIVSTRFTDRVFQRSLSYNYLTHEIQKDFIADNYACQVGKGNHKAIKGFVRHLHLFALENGLNGYMLKCDIHDYFGSTPHKVAKSSTDYVRDGWSKKELHRIIDSFSQGNDPLKGMGLGSEITQSVQLAILHPMDKTITTTYGVKHYIRYMDDFYLFHENKDLLRKCLHYIINYME